MKKIIILLVFLTLYVFVPNLYAKTAQEVEQEIIQLQIQIDSLKTQAITLANQIAYYDSQISLNKLKIFQTEDLIDSLSGKITNLESQLSLKSTILVRQIAETYKSRNFEPLQLFLSSRSFSQFMYRAKYLELIQANNRTVLHDTQLTQTTYLGQKDLLLDSQSRLKSQKVSLDALRADRDNLLKQTQNSESVYQKQLQQAKLELEAIQEALAAATKIGPVKAGEPIALTGNTGYPDCSEGKHLHFEVHKGDSWINAETYLKTIIDKNSLKIGSGNWDWPLKNEIRITQRYGKTPWSYRYKYSDGIHTGIDMVSSSDIIYAPADGILYAGTGKSCRGLKLKYIDHGANLKTFYLHVQ